MTSITKFQSTTRDQAIGIIQKAAAINNGFFRINNFAILPHKEGLFPKNLYTLTFPDLPYHKIQRFWQRSSRIDVTNFNKLEEKLILEVENLYKESLLGISDYSAGQKEWIGVEKDFLNFINTFIIRKSNAIKAINVHVLRFGTGGSFYTPKKLPATFDIFVREDAIYRQTIPYLLIMALTRLDIFNEYKKHWSDSQTVAEWLLCETPLQRILNIDREELLKAITTWPTTQELKKSEAFLRKLGIRSSDQIFEVAKNDIYYNKRKLQDLTYTQKLVLKYMIENKDKIITYDELGDLIFRKDSEYSLYAINKLIERLRKKLEENGITSAYLATMRSEGYLLRS